nr:hypothetical protein [Xenorhabdus sp. psl]
MQKTRGFLCNVLTVVPLGQKTMIIILRFRHGIRGQITYHHLRANDYGVAGLHQNTMLVRDFSVNRKQSASELRRFKNKEIAKIFFVNASLIQELRVMKIPVYECHSEAFQ